jgi:hypothetical protein
MACKLTADVTSLMLTPHGYFIEQCKSFRHYFAIML